MVSPISVVINPRRQVSRAASPLSIVLVTPKIELGASAADDITIPAPDNELTEITNANEDTQLGNGFARAAYDYIESGSSVRVFALPFAVDRTDNADSARLPRVVTALGALSNEVELAKLPNRTCDLIVVPNETGRGTGANSVVSALKPFGLDTSLGAISVVDAGPTDGDRTQAAVTAWEAANADPNVVAISNSGDVAGQADMPGSVIMAGHWARYTSIHGIHAQPTNLRDTLTGVSNIQPERAFDERDGSSSAVVLAADPIYMTSIIDWNGSHYMWGGRTQHGAGDPRINIGNNLVSHRMVKEARRVLAPYLGVRGSPRILDGLTRTVGDTLAAQHVPNGVQSVEALDAVLTAGVVSVTVEVQFYDFIQSVRLTADVYV